MTIQLRLSPNAKASLSAFAVAKCLGRYQEAERLIRQYRSTLESEWREQEIESCRQRELRERREEEQRLSQEAWLDAFDSLLVGRVPMWRRIRASTGDIDLRGPHDRSNESKRNCGRKPRRFR